ncbi:MAG: symmetrical bis(5'-nucleosyl)-tetraphosphatase [Gammaproteobacteria bacterium]|nr:symmetrical bis(5'-nucleosyl)-tetraphosphatase [Gammaproteobacteria bacterium]MCW8922385.1 symmetrical bis(5'-nucleosyl)-tetraphosphatase [Gammaproteobacteria bacterium]
MATYAIGDIQGCYDELRQLLDKINFKSDCDNLWFTGDLVNRGPKSLETLRFVKSLADNAITVLGNHDLHLLAIAFTTNKSSKKDTLDEILNAVDREELLNWLAHRPLIHVDNDISMVHAAIHPDWSIQKAESLAEEVEAILQGEQHINYYKNMYGDEPACWSDELRGYERLRYITNVFTRLRFCDQNHGLALRHKCKPGAQPDNLLPWFNVDNRTTENDSIIFGHWSTLVLAKDIEYKNVYPLDTGCLWGGYLTAMRIDDGSFAKTTLHCPQASKPHI